MLVTVKIMRKGVPMYFQSEVDVEEMDANNGKTGEDKWASNDDDLRYGENEEEFVKTPSAAKKAFDKFTRWMQGEKKKRVNSFSQSMHTAEKMGKGVKALASSPGIDWKQIAEEQLGDKFNKDEVETLNHSDDDDDIGNLNLVDDDDDEFDWASLEIIVEEGNHTSSDRNAARRSFARFRKSSPRDKNSKNSSQRKSTQRKSAQREAIKVEEYDESERYTKKDVKYKSLNSKMIDTLYKVGGDVEDDVFEFDSKEIVASKNEDYLLNQKVLKKPLSRRQAQLVMSTANVMVTKTANGRFGAAIKRKLKVKQKNKKRSAGNKQTRSPNVALHIQPRYLMLYFIMPLLLLALNDLVPIIEQYYNFLVYPDRFEDTQNHQLPYLIRILIPEEYVDILNRRLKIGAYALRVGGLYLTVNAIYRFFVLVNLLRPKPVLKRVSKKIDKKRDDDAPHNYKFLLKWQGESDSVNGSP